MQNRRACFLCTMCVATLDIFGDICYNGIMKEKNILGVKLPKTQHGNERFRELLQAAEVVFAKKGFYETSIVDICKAAGTAVGTFYIYFEDKIAVYRYLVYDFKLRIKRTLNAAIQGCESRYDRERNGIKSFIRFAYENPQCYNIIWGSLSVDKKIFEEYYIDFARSYAAGLVRDSSELKDIDIVTTAYTLMGITNFVGLKFILEDDFTEKPLDAAVDTVMNLLTDGIFKPLSLKKSQ